MRRDPISTAAKVDTMQRLFRGTLAFILVFAGLGTVTAVWANPFFVRMTPVGPWELAATAMTALFAGATAAFWVPLCDMRTSGTGGIASFLGIACPTCNKILMLIFGGPALLAWFDPVRPFLATAGVIVMALAAWKAWRTFRASQAMAAPAAPSPDPSTGFSG